MSKGGQKSSFGLVSNDWPTIVRGIRACGADASLVFSPSLSSSIFLLALFLVLSLSHSVRTLLRSYFWSWPFCVPRSPLIFLCPSTTTTTSAARASQSQLFFTLSLRTRQIIFFCQSSSSLSSYKQVFNWPTSFVSARNQEKVMQSATSIDILCADALLPAMLILECFDNVRQDARM